MYDLNSLDQTPKSEEGEFLPLEYNGEALTDDEGNPSGVVVLGPLSKKYKDGERKLRQERLARVTYNQDGSVKGLGDDEEQIMALYATLVVGYRGLKWNGKELKRPSTKTTLEIFERLPFIYEAVVKFVDNSSNWLGN